MLSPGRKERIVARGEFREWNEVETFVRDIRRFIFDIRGGRSEIRLYNVVRYCGKVFVSRHGCPVWNVFDSRRLDFFSLFRFWLQARRREREKESLFFDSSYSHFTSNSSGLRPHREYLVSTSITFVISFRLTGSHQLWKSFKTSQRTRGRARAGEWLNKTCLIWWI